MVFFLISRPLKFPSDNHALLHVLLFYLFIPVRISQIPRLLYSGSLILQSSYRFYTFLNTYAIVFLQLHETLLKTCLIQTSTKHLSWPFRQDCFYYQAADYTAASIRNAAMAPIL